MHMNPLTAKHLVQLDAVVLKIKSKFGQPVPDPHDHWIMLENSEALLIAVMDHANPMPPVKKPAYIECGLILYFLHHAGLTPKELKWLEIPDTRIDDAKLKKWDKEISGEGAVGDDGTFLSNVPYGQFDFNWSLAALSYIWLLIDPKSKADFGSTPVPGTFPSKPGEKLKIAIMGDWGSGPWDDGPDFPAPAVLVGKAITSLNPDITIHLGDVYYAGYSWEEGDNLLPTFPKGTRASFTMNSNHEMYDGGNGYFGTGIGKNQNIFNQGGTSYFSFVFQDWLVIGLDSGFYDDSKFFMAGAIAPVNAINPAQSVFIQDQIKKYPGYKVILLTHHIALELDGLSVNTLLFRQIFQAFGGYCPDFWYYGHTHNGIVYNDLSVLGTGGYKTASGRIPKARCMGHGALPFGQAYGLMAGGKQIPTVDYFAQTPMPKDTNDRQQYRVLNGFAILTLGQGSITEEVYEVQGVKGGGVIKTMKWQKTTTY